MDRRTECACGQVFGVLEGDPVRVLACHCNYCQKRTGSVFQVSCWYPHERVIELGGETKSFAESPDSIGVKYEFCPRCGSTVHWAFDALEEAVPGISRFRGFAVGCFVDKNFPMPEIEIHTQCRHHWLPEIENTPGFEAFAELGVLLKDL